MSKETLIVEGVRDSLKGLSTVMETLSDTGENAELTMKIEKAIEVAEWMTSDGVTEEQFRRTQRGIT